MHVCLNCSISHSVLSIISKSLHFGGPCTYRIPFISFTACTHTHTHTNTRAYAHTHAHTLHTHTHTHTHICHTHNMHMYIVHTYTHAWAPYTVCTCTHILRHTHEQTHMHAHMLNFCIMYILLYLLRINGWLSLLLGKIQSCFAMTEPAVASSNATNIQSEIRCDGDYYVFNGHKWWISGAVLPNCSICIFMGKTDPSAAKHQQQVEWIFLIVLYWLLDQQS